MKEIIKVLLQEGIDEETIHEVLDVLEEEVPVKKERKNNKTSCYMRMDDPKKNKIGVKKKYNRVIHSTTGGQTYVKIKGTPYYVDKYNEIGAPVDKRLYDTK